MSLEMLKVITQNKTFSKIGISILLIIVMAFMQACINQDFEWKTNTEITFINETKDTIFTEGILCEAEVILPQDEMIYIHEQFEFGTSKSQRPESISDLEVVIRCAFFFGQSGKCINNIGNVEDFDNFQKTGDLQFSAKYTFTEEKKTNAKTCE